jgi:hypothetical protein
MTAVEPADDARHEPGAGAWWSEAWHLDAARADGTGISVRLECYPNRGVAWFCAHLVLPDLPGPVVVRDHEVALPRQGLEVRAEGLWAELWCETPLEHWTYGLEAFGVRLDDPHDALTSERGERVAVGLDLEWEEGAPCHARGPDWPVRGLVQAGAVHGEVLLGRSRFELDAWGERRHSWGERDWFGRRGWACGLRAGDLVAHVSAAEPAAVDGYAWRGGAAATRVRSARAETHRRRDGLPVAARYVVDDAWESEVEVLGLAPVPLRDGARRATLARAVCRYRVEEASGIGWSSWLDPG